MRRPNNLGGLWEKGKARDMFREMGMDYWLAMTEKAQWGPCYCAMAR